MDSPIALFKGFLRRRSEFFRDIVTVIGGTALSRVVAFAALPVLSRIYTPEEFGVLALFSLVFVVVGCVANACYEVAIVLPDEDRDALHLIIAAVAITTLTSALMSVALWFWSADLAEFLGEDQLIFWLPFTPFVVWVLSVANILNYWVMRKKQFSIIAVGEVLGTMVNVGTQIGLHFAFRLGAGGLILGQIAYQLSHLIILGYGAARSIVWGDLRSFQISRAIQLLKRYKNFPRFDAWATLLSAASREFPILILGIYFSSGVIGLYSIGFRIMSMPVMVISRGVTRVFLPKAKAGLAVGKLDGIALDLLRKMLALSATPTLLLMVGAPEVVKILLGDVWTEAGFYIQWLAVFMLTQFLIMPVIQILFVLEKQRQRLNYQIMLALGRAVGLIIGGIQNDPLLAVALASSIGATVTFVTIIIVMSYAKVGTRRSMGLFVTELVKALPFMAALLLVETWWPGDLVVFLAFIALGLLFCILRFEQIFRFERKRAPG